MSRLVVYFLLGWMVTAVMSLEQPPAMSVEQTLDAFHKAASEADGKTYFGLFVSSNAAYFIGTDATERWSVEEFRKYAAPHFARGQGWTYRPRNRHVYHSTDGSVAWFNEMLDNDRFGTARGSGVLVVEEDNNEEQTEKRRKWKVAQYHLTVPIPNALMDKVVEMIRDNPATEEE
jgi:hypothetical protein